MPKKLTQKELILQYYFENEDRDIPHEEVVDWATNAYLKRTGKVFRDPDRAIRLLYQEGRLIKIRKGVYRYSKLGVFIEQLNFSESQKNEILRRDNYRCVICGKGREHGMELHVDHIKPKAQGGVATIQNGQTLCSQHNIMKKTLSQTETGKKMFKKYYELAKNENDSKLLEFFKEVLELYEKHDINGHIEWHR